MSQHVRVYPRSEYLRSICWDAKGKRFLCADRRLSRVELGRLIVDALSKGEGEVFIPFMRKRGGDWTESWGVNFSVHYVLSMLAFVGEHGWFWDAVEDSEDHAFTPNQITPGVHWTEVESLKQAVAYQNERAKKFADLCEGNMAAEFAASARRLSAVASRLLPLGVPKRRS